MGKRFAIVAIVLLVLAVLGWRFAVASREAMLPGVRVMGVDVGGMSAAEAEAHLRSQLPAPEAIRLPLRTEAQTWHLTWAEVGQRYRIDAMVEAALEISRSTPWQRRGLLALGLHSQQHDVAPDVALADPAQATMHLEEIAAQVATPPVEADLQIGPGGRLSARQGQAGQQLDLEASAARVMMALEASAAVAHRRDLDAVELVVAAIPPERAAPEPAYSAAQALLARPFTLVADDPLTGEMPEGYHAEFSVATGTLASWIVLRPTPAQIELEINQAAVRTWLENIAPQIEGEMRRLDVPATFGETIAALRAPTHRARAQIGHTARNYIVQPGDAFYDIAYNFGFPQWHLEQANPEVEPGALNVGQQLTIPSLDVLFPHPIPPDKRIEIDLPTQRMHVFDRGQQIFTFTVSSGISSTPTIAGQFQILFKEKDAFAQRWSLEMPHFMGIYEEAEGFHNGIHELPIMAWGTRLSPGVLGWPASFGCIILDEGDAGALFEWAEIGTLVRIHGVAPGTPTWSQTLGDLVPLTPDDS